MDFRVNRINTDFDVIEASLFKASGIFPAQKGSICNEDGVKASLMGFFDHYS